MRRARARRARRPRREAPPAAPASSRPPGPGRRVVVDRLERRAERADPREVPRERVLCGEVGRPPGGRGVRDRELPDPVEVGHAQLLGELGQALALGDPSDAGQRPVVLRRHPPGDVLADVAPARRPVCDSNRSTRSADRGTAPGARGRASRSRARDGGGSATSSSQAASSSARSATLRTSSPSNGSGSTGTTRPTNGTPASRAPSRSVIASPTNIASSGSMPRSSMTRRRISALVGGVP